NGLRPRGERGELHLQLLDPPLLLCHQRRLRLQLAAKLFQIVGFQSRPRRRARAGGEQGGGGEQAEAQGDSSSRGTRAASIDDLRGGPDKSKNAVRGRGLRRRQDADLCALCRGGG